MIGSTGNYRFYVEPVGISPFASFSRYDKGGQTLMKQVGTCYGFAGIVLQVGRNFIVPVTVLQEKCSRWNISSLVLHQYLWPSGAVKHETLPDGHELVAFDCKNDTIRQTLTLNYAWRFYIWVLRHHHGREIPFYLDTGFCTWSQISVLVNFRSQFGAKMKNRHPRYLECRFWWLRQDSNL